MSDIFISYAREDRAPAQQLARVFERQGWTVWWDKVIPPGRRYEDVIGEELAGARAVVVLWSKASVASDWVKDEAASGAARGVLVPALVEKVSPPLGFRQVQTADLSAWDGSDSNEELEGMLRAVADLIKKPFAVVGTDLSVKDDARPRRTWLYLAAGLLLASALGFGAYRLLYPGGGGGKVHEGNTGTGGGNTGTGGPCALEARHRAADTTIEGLKLLDPDFKDEQAVLKFKEAVAECADYADAYFYRGQSYVRLGDPESALEDFKTALRLSLDRNNERQARKFISELEGKGETQDNRNANAVAANTGPGNRNSRLPPANTTANTSTNTSANANGAQNTNAATHDPSLPRVQVADIFADDKTKRIAATTRLIIERKQDSAAVKQAVAGALADPKNKSGVINTLVYLENVDPAILKQYRAEIEKLFDAANDNGPQTIEHIKKVRERMGS